MGAWEMIAGQCRECGYLLVMIENDGLCRSQEPAGGEIGGGERLAQMLRIATKLQPTTITSLFQTKEQGDQTNQPNTTVI